MKRYFFTLRYKLNVQRRSRTSLLARRRFNNYLKERNKTRNLPNKEKLQRRFASKFKDFKKVKAPPNLSLIKNPEAVIGFIKLLKANFLAKKKVYVILKDVTNIDYDAIVVLLSIMIRFKSQKIEFNGDFPDDPYCQQKLIDSKFLPNLNKYLPDDDRYKLGDFNAIHTHAWKHVDSKLGAIIIERASQRIWNEKRRCQGVQRTFIELMQNTNNHATIGKPGDKHWWLSVNFDPYENKVCFSFVDFGVGVFESLNQKGKGSKFFDWAKKMASRFSYKNNAELLKLILEGDLHKTVTGEHYRGKGLPGIKEAFNRNQISNLCIITNDVLADVKNNNYIMLNKNFEGTFLYWELNNQNLSCHGTH